MRRISLFRHAKSDWSDLDKSDFDRPLNIRGKKAAPLMGAYMSEQGIAPGVIYCSPAKRARATLDLVADQFTHGPEIIFEDGLYMADARTMLDLVHNLSDSCDHVMIVGHNPGLHVLALALLEMAHNEDYLKIIGKFPTAALAVIEFDCGKWSEILPGRGRLHRFMSPKALN